MSSDMRNNSKMKTPQEREIEKMLVNGEELLIVGKLHAALYWKPVALLILGVLFYFIIPPFGIMFCLVGVVFLCISILTQHFLLLAVTSKRVLARQGLLQMDIIDIRLSKIESIDLERMLPGHIFGYANVVVMGTGQRLIRIPYIANADQFRRFYNELVLAAEGNEEAARELKDSGLQDDGGKPKARGRKKATPQE